MEEKNVVNELRNKYSDNQINHYNEEVKDLKVQSTYLNYLNWITIILITINVALEWKNNYYEQWLHITFFVAILMCMVSLTLSQITNTKIKNCNMKIIDLYTERAMMNS